MPFLNCDRLLSTCEADTTENIKKLFKYAILDCEEEYLCDFEKYSP